MLRILTAGESHGKSLVGVIEGFPANVKIDIDRVNHDLGRRQQGYGRGGRMKIEQDQIEIISGVRGGRTLGSPIAFLIANRDYENWKAHMDPIRDNEDTRRVTKPRPGHADLAGAEKYRFDDIRNVLERSSARETAVRVAAGSIIKQLLEAFQIQVYSHVINIGGVQVDGEEIEIDQLKLAEESSVRCIDQQKEAEMIAAIEEAKGKGDSLGGIFEIRITGVPVGLGSYVHWDRKLDAQLAYSLMGIQGIKGVEIGEGFSNASRKGSRVHDEIYYDTNRGYYRKTNYAGGIEGGMSNGENIVLRCAMKPIPTLYEPLHTVDIITKEASLASVERSDTCAVPAASIVGEMAALVVIAEELMRKYGGDSIEEMLSRWKK